MLESSQKIDQTSARQLRRGRGRAGRRGNGEDAHGVQLFGRSGGRLLNGSYNIRAQARRAQRGRAVAGNRAGGIADGINHGIPLRSLTRGIPVLGLKSRSS